MTTKLKLYNNALLLLKQKTLTATSDDDLVRYKLDDVYDEVLNFCLEEGDWNFATLTVSIDASDTQIPEFGFSFAFEKPTDWLRTTAISANAYFADAFSDYQDEGAYFLANCDPLYLRYVSNDSAAGLDLSLWSNAFTRFVTHELAYRVAPHITTMGDQAMELLRRDVIRTLGKAKSLDARGGPSTRLPPGRLVTARAAMRGSRRSYYRNNW